MKRLLLILVSVLLVAGCGSGSEPEPKYSIQEMDKILVSHTSPVWVYRFEYDGHRYIEFAQGKITGFVHDPDCPCMHKNEE